MSAPDTPALDGGRLLLRTRRAAATAGPSAPEKRSAVRAIPGRYGIHFGGGDGLQIA